MPQVAPFRCCRRVEFRDTDAAGIVHFSVYFNYMEAAEHKLLREVGLSVKFNDETSIVSWPRVSASCEYHSAARFEQVVTISVLVERMGDKSIQFGFRIHHDERLIASGRFTVVCCRIREGLPPESIPVPEEFRQRLARYVGQFE